MHIIIKTQVEADYQFVCDNFDDRLFKKLNPPFPPVKLLRYDGSRKGDEVHLELNFLLFRQRWESLIIESNYNNEEFYFIDKGIKLPFFLRFWEHKHRIINNNSGALIIDDVNYKSFHIIADYLLYPLFYLQFLYRKPIYKKIFKAKKFLKH